MRIVMLGLPGAGKGTQAKRLSKKLNLPHLSTGDLLRDAVSRKTSLGKKAKSYMSRGELVPDPIILSIVKEKIEKHRDGFIMDGFPRNISQARELDEYLTQKKKELDVVVNLEVDEETIIKRLTGRRICPNCRKIYHVKNTPSNMVCESCGVKLRQREDDREETVRNRLKVYYEETYPLVEYYRKKGILRSVSGKGSPDEVFNRILALL